MFAGSDVGVFSVAWSIDFNGGVWSAAFNDMSGDFDGLVEFNGVVGSDKDRFGIFCV